MRRTRAPDNAVALPAMVDTEAGGFYTAGPPATVFSSTWTFGCCAFQRSTASSMPGTQDQNDSFTAPVEGSHAVEAA